MNNLPKAFNSQESESKIYEQWEKSGLMNPDNMEQYLRNEGLDIKTPFTITLPPPNANGDLHLGHMCGYSYHDAIGRYMRMTGHPTLLLPGKDHAGIQTETAFTKKLQNEGIDKWELGQEEFYNRCYDFSMHNAKNAARQEKRIGLSADYSREFFTLDSRLTKIIYETFYKMYEDGLVYRDKRIINQCPNCKTALADVDTEHEERRGIFAYIKYPLIEKEDMSKISTVVLDLHQVLGQGKADRDERILKLLNIEKKDLVEKFFKKLKKHFVESDTMFDEEAFWEGVQKEFDITNEQREEFRDIWLEKFELYDGVRAFLNELKQNNIKLMILSNSYSVWSNSWIADILEEFEGTLYSGDHKFRGKPYQDIYEYLQKEEDLSSDEIVFVDDKARNITIAEELGWKGILFKKDYSEILDYILKGQRYITVATTRPETMLGDTAVAVNPEDERYTKFIGKKVLLPIANREIPIIADEEVDMETGTAALKVTPAHSPIDFELGKKHDLEIINVIDEEGKMTGDIPERFVGMETVECSKAICGELDELGLLVKIENIKHDVAVCERCKTPIEPIISNQWYIDTEPLAEKALEALKNGDLKVIPEGQQRALEHFYENIQPWCISRQLWWGQRIPVWYSGSKKLYDWLQENEGKTVFDYEQETGLEANGTGEISLGEDSPGENWEQETDMFDTWFSSGQWPYSTLGGPEGEDFAKYYPTQMMIHARDILFWWTARMVMMGLYRTKQLPYSTAFLTGMILASDGSKMSKSKGNGVEPTEVFEKYGADALRLWYYADALPGSNAPLREEKIKGNRNFVNKIWNGSRFILFNIDESELEAIAEHDVNLEDERIVKTKEHIDQVSKYIEKYQFNLGAEYIREFFWHTLCDVWIEEIKEEIKDEEIGSDLRIQKLSELTYILKENLKIMHPFVPYVTEAIWQELVNIGLAEGILMGQQI
jgi:HAD superfamily hydrolase (TIGR01509 family)